MTRRRRKSSLGSTPSVAAPLCDPVEVGPLCEAGADELYCGVMTPAWQRAYSAMQSPNRRDVVRGSLGSMAQLREVVRWAHGAGARVAYTANVFYGRSQLEAALDDVAAALDAGVDAVIIADLGFAAALQDAAQTGGGWELHASTVASIYSSAAARPWARLGARRVVLPRDLTLDQVEQLTRALATGPELQAELLVCNVMCKFSDGFCGHDHGGAELGSPVEVAPRPRDQPMENRGAVLRPSTLNLVANRIATGDLGQACMLPYAVQVLESPPGDPDGAATQQAFEAGAGAWRHLDACGGCLLHRLAAAGVAAFKIAGREHPTRRKLADVRFLRAVLRLAPANPDPRQLREAVQTIHQQVYGYGCSEFCYYQ